MKQILVLIFFIGSIGHLSAQEGLKIGHVNIPEIIQKLPEADSVRLVLEKETKEMGQLYDEMIKEYDLNLDKFEQEMEGYSELVKKVKEKEIRESAAKIQQFNQTANEQIEKRSIALQQPIYQKVNNAISRVAAREKFTYILDVSNGTVVYKDPTSLNINSLVLKELGL